MVLLKSDWITLWLKRCLVLSTILCMDTHTSSCMNVLTCDAFIVTMLFPFLQNIGTIISLKKITLFLIKFKKVQLFSHLIIMLQISFQSNNNYIYTLSYYTFEKLTLSICHKIIVPSHRVVQHRFIWGLDRKNFATQD